MIHKINTLLIIWTLQFSSLLWCKYSILHLIDFCRTPMSLQLYLPVINASFTIDFLKAWTLIVNENDLFVMIFFN